jgi:hypothetical protein
VPEKHYMLPVLPRLAGVAATIANEDYFILHAPRRSGKTTFIQALVKKINSDGHYYAFYCSIDATQNIDDDDKAMTRIAEQINRALKMTGIQELVTLSYPDDSLPNAGTSVKIRTFLNYLSLNLNKKLIVIFDEADCLSGAPLMTFLRQIRQGYIDRSFSAVSKFPSTLALVGTRNIRDYLASNQSAGKHLASPFNIVAERMTLANFTQDEIGQLYSQHTEATGQVFHDGAIERAWYWTEGQPWLVNALARQTVKVILKNDYSVNISAKIIDDAAQSLILRNDTHFYSLKVRLKEPRVRRVIEAILIGSDGFPNSIADDDVAYVLDLGLLKKNSTDGTIIQPSNPIYQEVIVRTLITKIQPEIDRAITITFGNKWMDGISLDMNALLKAFQIYWSENSEMYIQNNYIESLVFTSINIALKNLNLSSQNELNNEIVETIQDNLIVLTNEALTHLVLYAFLQRVLNGGADFIQREYALGTFRADICVSYKGIRYPLKLKIKGHKSQEESIRRLKSYMDKCLASEGWLLTFDKDYSKPWNEKISWETIEDKDQIIHLVCC